MVRWRLQHEGGPQRWAAPRQGLRPRAAVLDVFGERGAVMNVGTGSLSVRVAAKTVEANRESFMTLLRGLKRSDPMK